MREREASLQRKRSPGASPWPYPGRVTGSALCLMRAAIIHKEIHNKSQKHRGRGGRQTVNNCRNPAKGNGQRQPVLEELWQRTDAAGGLLSGSEQRGGSRGEPSQESSVGEPWRPESVCSLWGAGSELVRQEQAGPRRKEANCKGQTAYTKLSHLPQSCPETNQAHSFCQRGAGPCTST